MRPKGKLKIDHVDLRNKPDIACYFDIYVRDENGELFKTRASSFTFDLKPVSESGVAADAESRCKCGGKLEYNRCLKCGELNS